MRHRTTRRTPQGRPNAPDQGRDHEESHKLKPCERAVIDVHVATPNGISNHLFVECHPKSGAERPGPNVTTATTTTIHNGNTTTTLTRFESNPPGIVLPPLTVLPLGTQWPAATVLAPGPVNERPERVTDAGTRPDAGERAPTVPTPEPAASRANSASAGCTGCTGITRLDAFAFRSFNLLRTNSVVQRSRESRHRSRDFAGARACSLGGLDAQPNQVASTIEPPPPLPTAPPLSLRLPPLPPAPASAQAVVPKQPKRGVATTPTKVERERDRPKGQRSRPSLLKRLIRQDR